VANACPCRKLHPAVLRMKSTENRQRSKLRPGPAGGQENRCPVTKAFGVRCSSRRRRQGSGADGSRKDDDMIEAFAADRTDQSFRMPVLPEQRQYKRKPVRCRRSIISGGMADRATRRAVGRRPTISASRRQAAQRIQLMPQQDNLGFQLRPRLEREDRSLVSM
jgi:hypothetical protein